MKVSNLHQLEKRECQSSHRVAGSRYFPPLPMPCLYANINNNGVKVTSVMCAVETEDCFCHIDMICVQYRCWYRSIFSDTADTKYEIPVSVSPYYYGL